MVLRADPRLATLLDFRYRRRHIAQNGQPGGSKDCTGADGERLVVNLPVGTEVFDDQTEELIVDLCEPGQEFLLAPGGLGGRGNVHFATAAHRSPDYAQPGRPGQELEVHLVLKLLADVGLVGFPNAGKSTFVSRISRARPKIADYPFTTLQPHLGVVSVDTERSYVVADMPGLIEGAAEGAGLGHQFLRHLERTALFVFLVTQDMTPGRTPMSDFLALRSELGRYEPELLERPFIVVLSQADRPEVAEQYEELRASLKDVPVFQMSAVTGFGVDDVLHAIAAQLEASGRWSDLPR